MAALHTMGPLVCRDAEAAAEAAVLISTHPDLTAVTVEQTDASLVFSWEGEEGSDEYLISERIDEVVRDYR